MIDGKMAVWTILWNPDDHSGRWVVVVDVIGAEPFRQPERWFARDLEHAREIIAKNDPHADCRIYRDPSDAPCIVEAWL